jgi:hypothetical protein
LEGLGVVALGSSAPRACASALVATLSWDGVEDHRRHALCLGAVDAGVGQGEAVAHATGVSRGRNTRRSLATVTASGCLGRASPVSHHSPRFQYAISGGFWPSTAPSRAGFAVAELASFYGAQRTVGEMLRRMRCAGACGGRALGSGRAACRCWGRRRGRNELMPMTKTTPPPALVAGVC